MKSLSQNPLLRLGAGFGLAAALLFTVFRAIPAALGHPELDGTVQGALVVGGRTALWLPAVAGIVGARRAGTFRGGVMVALIAVMVGTLAQIGSIWAATLVFIEYARHSPVALAEAINQGQISSIDSMIFHDATVQGISTISQALALGVAGGVGSAILWAGSQRAHRNLRRALFVVVAAGVTLLVLGLSGLLLVLVVFAGMLLAGITVGSRHLCKSLLFAEHQ